MKILTAFLLAAMLVIPLAGCGNEPESVSEPESSQSSASETVSAEPEESSPSGQDEGVGDEESETSNILVAYFSWADNAVLAEDVDAVASPSVIAPGNVQELAGWVQEETGGDIFGIRVTDPYPSDWDDCLARANQERGDQARPALQEQVENLEQYDTVFLGYPNWWYGVPMALLTFLEENDLTGKQVYLFCSHGTGGLSNSVDIISEALPNATISDNIFDCYEEDAAGSQADIQSWVENLGYTVSEAAGESAAVREEAEALQISVQWEDHMVIYELNDSTAARALYDQLPLTLEVDDFSTNEKIFYPPEALDTGDAPQAAGGAGTLAYYAPWGDVVMFYDSYDANASLFELGRIVSGEEWVPEMSGTITIDVSANES